VAAAEANPSSKQWLNQTLAIMKILCGLMIILGVIFILLAFGGGSFERPMFIGGPILIAGAAIALSIKSQRLHSGKSEEKTPAP
jgi:hypothetical protein